MPNTNNPLGPLRGPLMVFGLLLIAPVAALAKPDPSNNPINLSIEYLRGLLKQDNRALLVTDHQTTIAAERMSLSFRLTGERTLDIAMAEGDVLIDDRTVGHYEPGGQFHASFRNLILEASRRPTADFLELAHDWSPDGLSPAEDPAAHRVHSRLTSLRVIASTVLRSQAIQQAPTGGTTISLDDLSNPAAMEPALRAAAASSPQLLRLTVPGGSARFGDYTIGSGETINGNLLLLRGNANVYGILNGNLATVDGNIVVHPGAVVTGDVLALGGAIQDAGGEIRGEIRTLSPVIPGTTVAIPPVSGVQLFFRNLAGVSGVFLTLVALGFGLVLFGRPNLEVVADTVSHTFGRSFVVGLLAEMLLLPTFGMLVVGLLLSVVGVLLIPFAVLAYGLLLLLGVVGGYLAVAHALGESYTRRRLALGMSATSPNSYRYVMVGLALMMAFWGGWVLFGWVPIAGTMIKVAAVLVTWLLATVGFGATLLSRAGVRESFTGRLLPPEALTDEYLWATPQFGVPAAKRPPRSISKDSQQ
jgi:hypothetical protein